MAKLFFIVSMCLVSVMAAPNAKVIPPMSLFTSVLNAHNKPLSGCTLDFLNQVKNDFLEGGQASRDCVKDCVKEVMQIHEDVYKSLQKAVDEIINVAQGLEGCTGKECAEIVGKIIDIAGQNSIDNARIIKEGILKIKDSYPHAYECTRDVFVQLAKNLHNDIAAYVQCLKQY